jgi:Zn-finger nucleic acid-binding protein
MANSPTPPASGKPADERIRCPHDAAYMEKLRAGRVTLDHCARCGRVWCDPYELAVASADRKTADAVDYGTAGHDYDNTMHNPGQLLCPRDGAPLIKVPDPRQPHVIIDICRTCGGVLLDAGELKDLSELTLAERLRGFFKK